MGKTIIKNHADLAAQSYAYAYNNAFFEKPFVSSGILAPLIDYQIAQDGDNTRFVYFGSLNSRGALPWFVQDVQQNGIDSPFYGCVLCTLSGAIDRSQDGNDWQPYKNKAFWAGAMDAHRHFYLITDIAWYYNKGNPDPFLGTCREILWLLDNGYAAHADPAYPKYTLFTPLETPGILSILKYDCDDKKNESVRLACLIRNILKERAQLPLSRSLMPHERHVSSNLISEVATKGFFAPSKESDVKASVAAIIGCIK